MSGFLPWLYLLRVPLIVMIALGGLAPFSLATGSPGRALLEGLFDLDAASVLTTTVGALFTAAACTFSAWLVLLYGERRFGATKRQGWTARKLPWEIVPEFQIDLMGALIAAASLLAAISLIAGVYWKVHDTRNASPVLPVVGGTAVFVIALFLAGWLWTKAQDVEDRFFAGLLAWTPQGYVQDDPHRLRLLNGHGFAISVALVSHGLYVAMGYRWFFANPEQVLAPNVPSLICVLLLLALLCWGLSAMAFFFDAFRTPILLPWAVLVIAASKWPESDHYFPVQHLPSAPPPTYARDVMNIEHPIVICMSGGGIQAAAWGGRVLTSLRAEMGPDFTKSVKLISAVSGGSAGALQFLGAWQANDVPAAQLNTIFDAASNPVLDEVAQGLIYPDLWRLAFPFFIQHQSGRGQAMERAWLRQGKFPAAMSAWNAEARSGTRPAVIFNSTVVESGERMMFSTVDFERESGRRRGDMKTFRELYSSRNLDVSPVTAARLSATFPFVSPAARADFDLPQGERYHFVDGGYYDNWGVSSAVDFMEQAVIRHGPGRVKDILVIQVRDRASGTGVQPASGSRGWLFQTIAPILTLRTVRDSGQIANDATELRLFRRAAHDTGRVTVCTVDFEYPVAEAPLSWYLDQKQKANITTQWNERYSHSPESCAVKLFLHPEDEECRKQISKISPDALCTRPPE